MLAKQPEADMSIRLEAPEDHARIDALLDAGFGKDRYKKTAYRLRENVAPVASLCLVAEKRNVFAATIRYWPVLIAARTPALLLGPIAVVPDFQSTGVGSVLMRFSLDLAHGDGHKIVLLVGDASYYQRFGFTRELTRSLELPGWVDLDRFLGLELVPGALSGVHGMVEKWSSALSEATDTFPGEKEDFRQAVA